MPRVELGSSAYEADDLPFVLTANTDDRIRTCIDLSYENSALPLSYIGSKPSSTSFLLA